MIVLGVGVWSILAEHTSIALLSPVTYPLTSYLLVIAGVVVIVAVIIGKLGTPIKMILFGNYKDLNYFIT